MKSLSQQELLNSEVTVYWAIPYMGGIQQVEVLRETEQTVWIRTYSTFYKRYSVDMRRKSGLVLYLSWEDARQAEIAMLNREIDKAEQRLGKLRCKLTKTEAMEDPAKAVAAEGPEVSANA